jgi:hypothetical protein
MNVVAGVSAALTVMYLLYNHTEVFELISSKLFGSEEGR